MARRAEWRRLPEDARGGLSLLRRWLREISSLPLVGEVLGTTLGVTLGSVMLAILAVSVAHRHTEWLFFSLLAFCVLVIRVMLSPRRLESCPKPPPSDLLPIPAPPDTFLVHLSIRHRGVLTGIDTAVAAFGDGWLYVDGRWTSFALRAEDGRAEWRDGALRMTFPDGQRLDLWLASGNDHLPKTSPSVLVGQRWMPWLAPNYSLFGASAYFYQATNLWIADREHPEGESILPPLAFHSTVRAGRILTTMTRTALPFFAAALLVFHLSSHVANMTTLAVILLATAWNVRNLVVRRQIEILGRKEPERRPSSPVLSQ